MSKPFISIVIPTKDRPHILANCLTQLQHSPFKFDIEVVIVDGSTDTTTQHLCSCHPLKDKITYIEEPNKLPYFDVPPYMRSPIAFLIGALHANGTYLCYLGDDDYINLDPFNNALNQLNEHNYDALIPELLAWDDIIKDSIARLVILPKDAPVFNAAESKELFYTIKYQSVYPEYFIYKTEKFHNAGIYLPGCYNHLVWLFLMSLQGTTKLDPDASFLLTRRSNLFEEDRADTPTPEFCRKMPEALARTCELITTRLLADEEKTMCEVEIPINVETAYYYSTSLVDSASVSLLQKDYWQTYIDYTRFLFWMPAAMAFRSREELIKTHFKNSFPHFLTSILIFRFQLLVHTKRMALWGFQNPESIAKHGFLAQHPDLPLDLSFNGKSAEVCAAAKDVFFVTRGIDDANALIKAGVPRVHTLSYEVLNSFFGLPFLDVVYQGL